MRDIVIIENLEIWPGDLGEMDWDEANTATSKLGPGWRLPTLDEFNEVLYPNRAKLFDDTSFAQYWSSAESDGGLAWYFDFDDGVAYPAFKDLTFYVLAVRDFDALEYLLKNF